MRALALVVAFVGMVAFSVVLARLTLTPSPASEDLVTSNLRPGHSLRQYAEDYTFLAACKQGGGNILLGVPFGVLLPVLVPRTMRLLRVVFLTALVMVFVELTQGALVAGRAFDIDDVILNTSGALLAYLLVGRRIGRRYHALADPQEDGDATRAGKQGAKQGAKQGILAKWTAAVGKTPSGKAPAKRAAAKRAPAKKSPAKKTAAKKPAAKKTAGRTPAKKAPVKKAPSGQTFADKVSAMIGIRKRGQTAASPRKTPK